MYGVCGRSALTDFPKMCLNDDITIYTSHRNSNLTYFLHFFWLARRFDFIMRARSRLVQLLTPPNCSSTARARFTSSARVFEFMRTLISGVMPNDFRSENTY